jgi:hypothetical protein
LNFEEALELELEAIKINLKQKNIQYGNSALQPILKKIMDRHIKQGCFCRGDK